MSINQKRIFKRALLHFYSLIDEHGIIQFVRLGRRDERFGYAVEDQARALILCLWLRDSQYAEFFVDTLLGAQKNKGGVRMLWGDQLTHEEKQKVDHFGEANAEVVWALAEYYTQKKKKKIITYLDAALENLIHSPYPRVWAYALLGLCQLKGRKYQEMLILFADKLVDEYQTFSTKKWWWFEDALYYANALLPWALFEAYEKTGEEKYKCIAEKTLRFLFHHSRKDMNGHGIPVVVGNKGWWRKNTSQPLFDQQPLDVAYLVLACIRAFDITKKYTYVREAKFYMSWFFGNNMLNVHMIFQNGACSDGLTKNGPNQNTGAEAMISFLLALSQFSKLNKKQVAQKSKNLLLMYEVENQLGQFANLQHLHINSTFLAH